SQPDFESVERRGLIEPARSRDTIEAEPDAASRGRSKEPIGRIGEAREPPTDHLAHTLWKPDLVHREPPVLARAVRAQPSFVAEMEQQLPQEERISCRLRRERVDELWGSFAAGRSCGEERGDGLSMEPLQGHPIDWKIAPQLCHGVGERMLAS